MGISCVPRDAIVTSSVSRPARASSRLFRTTRSNRIKRLFHASAIAVAGIADTSGTHAILPAPYIQDLIAATCRRLRTRRPGNRGRARHPRCNGRALPVCRHNSNIGDCGSMAGGSVAPTRDTVGVHKFFEAKTHLLHFRSGCAGRAHRMLSDQRLGDRTISSVAFDVGFGDLCINRFPSMPDATLSEIRHSAENTRTPPTAAFFDGWLRSRLSRNWRIGVPDLPSLFDGGSPGVLMHEREAKTQANARIGIRGQSIFLVRTARGFPSRAHSSPKFTSGAESGRRLVWSRFCRGSRDPASRRLPYTSSSVTRRW